LTDCMLGALFGALIGTLLGALQVWRKNSDLSERAQQDIMYGLIYGTAAGGLGVAAYLVFYILFHKDGTFKKELEQKREALRRKEAEAMERHDEVIYYDAGREQTFLYRIFCCPHFGKITTKRIIYSRSKPPTYEYWYPFKKYCCACWLSWCVCTEKFKFWKFITVYTYFTSCFVKEVESLDYDLVMDVSVEQKCAQFLSDEGTVVIHCAANSDTSIVKDEKIKIVEALNRSSNENINIDDRERELRLAIETAMQVKSLGPFIDKAKKEVARLVGERKKIAQTEGKPFEQIYVAEDRKNNPSRIKVLDVHKPYAVMDELSYKIAEKVDLSAKVTRLIEESGDNMQMMNIGMAPDEEEKV
jgi:hypothetical protein